VHEGVDQALVVAEKLLPDMAHLLTRSVHLAYDSAYFTALAIDAALLAALAIMAWRTRAAPPAGGASGRCASCPARRHDLGRPSAPARTTEAAARHPGAAVTIVQIPHDDASVTASRRISRMMTAGRTSPLCQGQCAAVCREGNRHLGADETAAPANQGGPFRCHSPHQVQLCPPPCPV
jgi:hypothetical protein